MFKKLDDYDVRGVPQEQIDFNDDVQIIINNGKYQKTIVSTPPDWVGRGGEEAYQIAGGSSSLYMCSSDNSSVHWDIVATFNVS